MHVCSIGRFSIPLSVLQGEAVHQMVRIAGDRGSEVWPFTVNLPDAASHLHIELCVSFWDRLAPEIVTLAQAGLKPWTTLLAGTTFLSEWTFSAAASSDVAQ